MIVVPKDVGQVSSVLKMCNEDSIPVIPFSTTTGLDGFSNTLQVYYFTSIFLQYLFYLVKIIVSD